MIRVYLCYTLAWPSLGTWVKLGTYQMIVLDIYKRCLLVERSKCIGLASTIAKYIWSKINRWYMISILSAKNEKTGVVNDDGTNIME